MIEIIIAIILQIATLTGTVPKDSGTTETTKEKENKEETTKKQGGVGDWKEGPK